MEFFNWVGDASPWLWLALGITLIALEILAPSFILIWPGLAAMVIALLTAIAPRYLPWLDNLFTGPALIALFAALSIGLLLVGRSLMSRVEQDEPQAVLNARGLNMVGRDAKVLSVSGPQGKVEIDGVQWPATWEDGTMPEAGGWVNITQSSGVGLRAKAK